MAPPPGKVVLGHQLVHKALAIVPGFRGSAHHIPELEASRMFAPHFCQLQPQQDVIPSPIGKEQWTHGMVTQDQLQHLGDACSSHNHANRFHCLGVGVGFLV